MFAKKTAGDIVTSTADEYAKEGVPLTPADNDRISGKRKIHRLFRPIADGRPGLIIFETCVNLIRTLPTLPLDERNPEDIDTNAEDHLYDALRYGLTNLAERPRHDRKEEQQPKSPYEQALDIL
jgi:hypothetical protein